MKIITNVGMAIGGNKSTGNKNLKTTTIVSFSLQIAKMTIK